MFGRITIEMYSEPCETTKIKYFAKIVNGFFLEKKNLFRKAGVLVFSQKYWDWKRKFPKTALSQRQTGWGVQNGPTTKNGYLPNCFIFMKIFFQFKNLLYRVGLMYQPTKCPYSYFS